MTKKILFVISILGILVFSGVGIHKVSAGAGQIQRLSFQPEMNVVLYFINYNESFIDTNTLENALPHEINKTYYYQANGNLIYNVRYQYLFANSSYTANFNSFIDNQKTLDWTSDLNQTALEQQKQDFKRMNIFTQREGYAIDARSTEQYLASHLPFTSLPDKNRFYLFVLNLSRLDSGSYDHWFNLTEVDPDSGKARFYWRLEWDYPLNYGVKFPYAAFTEKTGIAFIDPTAFQWYLKWRAIWNNMSSPHPSYFNDLDYLVANAATFTDKQNIVTDTVREWVSDWVVNIFNEPKGPVEEYPALGSSMSIQLRVFYDGNNTVFPATKLEWIINKDVTTEIFSNVIKTTNIEMSVIFTDINKDSYIMHELENAKKNYTDMYHVPPPFENWSYYSGITLYSNIYNEPERYFKLDAADTTVMGVIFLFENASFTDYFVPWTGNLYTGLGGGGKVVILYELNRAFMPDHVTHKEGLSSILIHEIGHAVGFPHPFYDTFTSDFASEVMGYYPGAYNFSQLFTEIYYRNMVDEKIVKFLNEYNQKYDEWEKDPDIVLQDRLYQSWAYFNETVLLHEQKDYLAAYETINTAFNKLYGITPTNTTSTTENITTITPTYSSPMPIDNNDENSFLPFSLMGVASGIISLIIIVKKKK